MWNQRYDRDEFAYGTEPNSFLAQNAKILIGPVLCLAEGEGRNAVFLASLGLEVLGVDGSEVGLAKAQKLAASRGLAIRTEVADLATYEPPRIFMAQSFRSLRISQVIIERDCIAWRSAASNPAELFYSRLTQKHKSLGIPVVRKILIHLANYPVGRRPGAGVARPGRDGAWHDSRASAQTCVRNHGLA
jgi:hypothetical protein